jgi:hypothetical protein
VDEPPNQSQGRVVTHLILISKEIIMNPQNQIKERVVSPNPHVAVARNYNETIKWKQNRTPKTKGLKRFFFYPLLLLQGIIMKPKSKVWSIHHRCPCKQFHLKMQTTDLVPIGGEGWSTLKTKVMNGCCITTPLKSNVWKGVFFPPDACVSNYNENAK